MSEDVKNPTLDAAKTDPEFQQFLMAKKADTAIAEYAKDEAGKALLDNGLRDLIKEDPSIIDNQAALKIAIKAAKEKALAGMQQQTQNGNSQSASVQPKQDTAAQQIDPQQRHISSVSLRELAKETGGNIGRAAELKVFGSMGSVINMS